jgi:hypothetical protein
MQRVLICSIVAFGVGFSLGRVTSPAPPLPVLHDTAVDCYDSSGNLLHNYFDQFGGVQTSCAPGQTAKLHGATY